MRLELTEFGIKVTNVQTGAVETDFSKLDLKVTKTCRNCLRRLRTLVIAEDIAESIISYCVYPKGAPDRVSINRNLYLSKSKFAEPRTIFFRK